MPHHHPTLDTVVSGFFGYRDRVLLVHHKKLDLWLAPGGHVEPGETFNAALVREMREETGLELETDYRVYQEPADHERVFRWKKFWVEETSRQEWRPAAIETHDFAPLEGHRHQCLVYFLCAAQLYEDTRVRLAAEEHHEIRWFTDDELEHTPMLASIRWYGHQAISISRRYR